MTEQSDKPSVDGLMELVADALRLILPMAKGYAAAHPVGANAEKVEHAEAALAALAGPLEQPQEPTSDQANLAQASGGEDLQTALPASHDVTACPYFGMYLDLSEASGYPHEKDTMVSPEEYGAALLKDAMRYRWLRDEALNFGHDDDSPSPWVVLGLDANDSFPTAYEELDEIVDAAMNAARVEPVGPSSSEPLSQNKPAASSESSLSVPKERQMKNDRDQVDALPGSQEWQNRWCAAAPTGQKDVGRMTRAAYEQGVQVGIEAGRLAALKEAAQMADEDAKEFGHPMKRAGAQAVAIRLRAAAAIGGQQ